MFAFTSSHSVLKHRLSTHFQGKSDSAVTIPLAEKRQGYSSLGASGVIREPFRCETRDCRYTTFETETGPVHPSWVSFIYVRHSRGQDPWAVLYLSRICSMGYHIEACFQRHYLRQQKSRPWAKQSSNMSSRLIWTARIC